MDVTEDKIEDTFEYFLGTSLNKQVCQGSYSWTNRQTITQKFNNNMLQTHEGSYKYAGNYMHE